MSAGQRFCLSENARIRSRAGPHVADRLISAVAHRVISLRQTFAWEQATLTIVAPADLTSSHPKSTSPRATSADPRGYRPPFRLPRQRAVAAAIENPPPASADILRSLQDQRGPEHGKGRAAPRRTPRIAAETIGTRLAAPPRGDRSPVEASSRRRGDNSRRQHADWRKNTPSREMPPDGRCREPPSVMLSTVSAVSVCARHPISASSRRRGAAASLPPFVEARGA